MSNSAVGVDPWALLDALADGMVVVDAIGKVAWTNAVLRRHDRGASFRIGGDFLAGAAQYFVPGPEQQQLRCGLGDVLRGRRDGFELARMPVASSGTDRRWATLAVQSCRGAGGPAASVRITDVTAERRARDAIRARDDLLQIAAHELKTPITSLVGYTEWLVREQDMAPARRDKAHATMLRQAAKLTRLVERLLDASQLETGRLVLVRQSADVVAVVRDALGAIARATNARLVLEAPASLAAFVDPLRLEQVVTNLVENAIHHGRPAGPVHITVRALGAEGAEITVTDQGNGVEPADRGRIFDRFFRGTVRTSSRGGLGLGLYISREIVALHGGTLALDPNEGAGACFRVTIPTGEAP